MIRPGEHPRLHRRDLLRLILVGSVTATLTACAPSPLITADRAPQAAPTLDQARRQVAQATANLIALTDASITVPDADEAFKSWCEALSSQHRAHLTVLCQADPLGGVLADPAPIETITADEVVAPGSQAEAMSALAEQELALAELLSTMPPSTATGKTDTDFTASMALLWDSQWICARTAAAALGSENSSDFGPAPVIGDAVPALTEMGDLLEALQVLLSQQRALVFGLQALYGRVDYREPIADQIAARLGQAMRERDATAAAIVADGGSPDPQPPEYVMPGDITDPSQAAQIWGALELAVLNAWARLAAVETSNHAQTLDQVFAQAERTRARGVALTYWPGWV